MDQQLFKEILTLIIQRSAKIGNQKRSLSQFVGKQSFQIIFMLVRKSATEEQCVRLLTDLLLIVLQKGLDSLWKEIK